MRADLCRRCGNPIYTYEPRVYAIVGYEESRRQGGANHVLLKQRQDGKVWHKACWEDAIKERERRRNGEQLGLLS